MPYGGWHLH